MSHTLPPLATITSNNYGAVNIIIAYVLIATTLAFTAVRFALGRHRTLRFDLDDACFAVAVVAGIATSVVSHIEVNAGLGRHQSTRTSHEVDRYFKLSYTDQFLGILAMTLAKCSILLLFRRLMSQSNLLVAFATLSSSIGVYFLFSIFATAFQCGLPHPWSLEPATCPTHGRILYAVIGMNMVTDGLLAVWIIPSIWNLQMERGPLHVVMSLFAARFVCVAVEAAQIVLTERSLRSADQTWAALPRAIIDQVVVHFSIIHAALPRTYPFLINLQTGIMATRMTTNIPLTDSKDNSGPRPSKGTKVSVANREHPRQSSKLSSIAAKTKKIGNTLYVSSSSHDYPEHNEKDDDVVDQDGNVINGMRLRPDIMPGSKWSTTIYADPLGTQQQQTQQRSRQHSSSTNHDRETPMGGRVDEEASTSSLTERNAQASDSDGPHPAPTEAQQRIWKTREFRMQIERVRGDGSAINVTKQENLRENLRDHLQDE